MNWDSTRFNRVVAVAQGREPADLCLRRCRIVNVLTGEVETNDLAVVDGVIAGWGAYEARQEMEADGFYVCPGFIDGHIHLESSLLSPQQFCGAVVPRGTAAVVADPHEIANVLGLDGVRYVLEATEGLPIDVFINLPSCVPASPLETSGAALGALDLHAMLPHDRIIGLAEMMNFPGVLQPSPDVRDKLLLFRECVMDGHAPQLSGLPLNAYIAAGIASDHECTTLEEAREKLSKGMTLKIREGSQSKDLASLLPAVTDHTWPHCLLVSDDCHPDDLLHRGHMNVLVNRAMEEGLEPVRALALATWTPARYFGLRRRGALVPGYRADFSLSPTLQPWTPCRVFKDGREVARDGRLLTSMEAWPRVSCPGSPMNLDPPLAQDLVVSAAPGLLRVIGVLEDSLLTKKLLLPPRVENGAVMADTARDILKIAIYNRYHPGRSPAVGFVQGIGLERGAMGTTVAHDSHNLIVVGADDSAMLAVVNILRSTGGGMAITEDASGTPEVLPLPVAGLMSDEPIETVAKGLATLKEKAKSLGSPLHNPFMALSFLALPVIPELKLTDMGLVDVSTFSFVSLFETP